MTIVRLLLLGLPLLLAGCGNSEQPPPPPPVKDTAFSGLAAAEDKARAVQATVDQHKEQLDQAIKESE